MLKRINNGDRVTVKDYTHKASVKINIYENRAKSLFNTAEKLGMASSTLAGGIDIMLHKVAENALLDGVAVYKLNGWCMNAKRCQQVLINLYKVSAIRGRRALNTPLFHKYVYGHNVPHFNQDAYMV